VAANANPGRLQDYALRWEWFVGYSARIEGAIREASLLLARNALARADWHDALQYANGLLRIDEMDPMASDIAVSALRALGDDFSAAKQLKRYKAAIEG